MTFDNILEGKNVLFIPIYSARSYETGLYQLQNDGNFARVYSAVKALPLSSATILIPKNSELHMENEESIKYVRSKYGKNAMETRKYLTISDLPHSIVAAMQKDMFDAIVCEPNYLTMSLATLFPDKVIYWCVASETVEGTPWFVEDYKDIDKAIAETIPTAVANKAQQLALQNEAFVEPSFYEPSLFDFKSIYFPFRLTDENYHANEFIAAITELAKDSSLKPFKVFYPDLNDCKKFDDLDKNIFVKVPKQHALYIQLLKSKPIIPYLENTDILEHISIHEFLYYGCELIMMRPKHSAVASNIVLLDDIKELTDALCEKLM